MPVFHKAIFLRESDNKRTVEAVRLRESSPHQHVSEIGHVQINYRTCLFDYV